VVSIPRRFARHARVVTYLTPPTLSSLPQERGQLEFSSRSMVFQDDGRSLRRVWGRPEDPWAIGVEPAGERWKVTAWGRDPPTARAAVRAMFALDDPIEEFYRQVRTEPVLRGTERRFRGLRLPRDPSLYEAILHAILGQQLSVAAARTIEARLVERTDAYLDVEGVELPRVPAPEELTRLGFDGLRAAGASGANARSLLALADRWGSGTLNADGLDVLALEAAVERLDREPGIGRWTAENALLRGVGRRDLFIAGDLGLRVALDRYGVVPRDAPESTARAWGDRYYPGWGSYATLYLWRRLVTEPPGSPADDAPVTVTGAGPPRGGTPHRVRGRSTSGAAR
jgi:DNA-3-methyladenine glycosylase II